MKKLIICIGCCAILLPLSSHAYKQPRNPFTGNRGATLPSFGANLRSAAVDTTLLAFYDFQLGPSCMPQGWATHDLNAQPGIMFHVSNFRKISGYKSMWCGAPANSSVEPWCSYAKLPGYGNNWSQALTSRVFNVSSTGSVLIDYNARYDSEPGYDYTYFQYYDGSAWQDLEVYTGRNGSAPADTSVVDLVVPRFGTNSVRVRFLFSSNGEWSDEDGLYDTNGAFIVDDISLDDNLGNVDTENWEDESIGSTSSLDNDWAGGAMPGYGDFAGLFAGISVLQEDRCSRDLSCLWGFFNGSTDNYVCDWPTPHPEQNVVPYENARGLFIANEIWSPVISFSGSGSTVILSFDVYKNLPLDNLVFFEWRVRSIVSSCPSEWRDHGYVYYGRHKFWLRLNESIGELIDPGAASVQLALGVVDMCRFWCGTLGTGWCHSHAPLFDNVKLVRVDTSGPQWGVRHIDLFQDNFPEDGTTTGAVRIDAAIDRMPSSALSIYTGDSLTVTCSEPNVGLGTGGDHGRADVYVYVRSTGGGNPSSWQAPETGVWGWNEVRFPYMGGGATPGGFYKFQCDTVYQNTAMNKPEKNKFCFDLKDGYFTPPARIDFYFAAEDSNGHTSYWTRFTDATASQTEAEAHPMEMQCLPTGESDILYVDGADDREGPAQIYFDSVFELLGITPDRYDILDPTAMGGNGLGSRAVPAQITNVYKKIIWNTGSRETGLVGDGSGSPQKSPDAQLLGHFLDQTSVWTPGLYLNGDNIAADMKAKGGVFTGTIFPYISYNVVSGDHTMAHAISPLVIGSTAGGFSAGYIFQHTGTPDTLIAYGGCPVINDFDVLQATGAAVQAMNYDPTGAGAVLTQQTTNAQGKRARIVLSGFGFNNIRDTRPQFPPARVDHMLHIIRWFENVVDDPTGADLPVAFSNYLRSNYPNPFNPVTTIKYGVKEHARVSLKIYNVAGQLVRTLVDEVQDPALVYTVQWRGDDNSGDPVASGVYFYRLVTRNFSQTRKMVLLK